MMEVASLNSNLDLSNEVGAADERVARGTAEHPV
jgi:hypothetical protein